MFPYRSFRSVSSAAAPLGGGLNPKQKFIEDVEALEVPSGPSGRGVTVRSGRFSVRHCVALQSCPCRSAGACSFAARCGVHAGLQRGRRAVQGAAKLLRLGPKPPFAPRTHDNPPGCRVVSPRCPACCSAARGSLPSWLSRALPRLESRRTTRLSSSKRRGPPPPLVAVLSCQFLYRASRLRRALLRPVAALRAPRRPLFRPRSPSLGPPIASLSASHPVLLCSLFTQDILQNETGQAWVTDAKEKVSKWPVQSALDYHRASMWLVRAANRRQPPPAAADCHPLPEQTHSLPGFISPASLLPLHPCADPSPTQVARQGRFSDYPEVAVEESWDMKATEWLAEHPVQKIVLRKANTRGSKIGPSWASPSGGASAPP